MEIHPERVLFHFIEKNKNMDKPIENHSNNVGTLYLAKTFVLVNLGARKKQSVNGLKEADLN